MKFVALYSSNSVFNDTLEYFNKKLSVAKNVDFKWSYECLKKMLVNPDKLSYFQASTSRELYYSLIKCVINGLSGKPELYYYSGLFGYNLSELDDNIKMLLLKQYADWLTGLWDYYDYIFNYVLENTVDSEGHFIRGATFYKPDKQHPQTLYTWLYTFYTVINSGLYGTFSGTPQFLILEKYSLWLDFLRLMFLPVFGKQSERGLYKYLTGKLNRKKMKVLDFYVNFVLKNKLPINWLCVNEAKYRTPSTEALTEYEWNYVLDNLKSYTVLTWLD